MTKMEVMTMPRVRSVLEAKLSTGTFRVSVGNVAGIIQECKMDSDEPKTKIPTSRAKGAREMGHPAGTFPMT